MESIFTSGYYVAGQKNVIGVKPSDSNEIDGEIEINRSDINEIEGVIDINRSDVNGEMSTQLNDKMDLFFSTRNISGFLTRTLLLECAKGSLQRMIDSDTLFDSRVTRVNGCNYTVKILLNERILRNANSHNRI